jgi:hypothetical protein
MTKENGLKPLLFHKCDNGTLRPYPSLLCSLCKTRKGPEDHFIQCDPKMVIVDYDDIKWLLPYFIHSDHMFYDIFGFSKEHIDNIKSAIWDTEKMLKAIEEDKKCS